MRAIRASTVLYSSAHAMPHVTSTKRWNATSWAGSECGTSVITLTATAHSRDEEPGV